MSVNPMHIESPIDTGDKRRNADLNKVKRAIIELLIPKPLQAKDLRKALKKKDPKKLDYSRDRLNDILNLMINEVDIERISLKDNPYPVYSVLDLSKTLAEFNGNIFHALFEKGMFQNCGVLLKEFEKSKHKKNKADALLQFFGFFVLGSLIASRMYNDKKQRSAWLRPVLDLDNNNAISGFLDKIVDEKTLDTITRVLIQNYKKNIKILEQAVVKQKSEFTKTQFKLINKLNQNLR